MADEHRPAMSGSEAIVRAAAALCGGAAALTVLSAGIPPVLAGSDATVIHLEVRQHDVGEGPGFEVLERAAPVHAVLPNSQWPGWSPLAAAAGYGVVDAWPLVSEGAPIGSLTVYLAERKRAAELRGCADLAACAVALFEAEGARVQAESTNHHLERALESRTLIGQAQGILMARQSIDAVQAFDVMRRASQRTNRKLHEIAAEIVRGASRREDRVLGTPEKPLR